MAFICFMLELLTFSLETARMVSLESSNDLFLESFCLVKRSSSDL